MDQNEKFKQLMAEKYGSWDNFLARMREYGRQGGKAKVPKGFAMNRELASQMGKRRSKSHVN